MKLKEGFELRQVGDDYVVITIGEAVKDFNGMIKLNKTSAFIWKELAKGTEIDSIIDMYSKEYGITEDAAKNDVNSFIEKIRKTNCLLD